MKYIESIRIDDGRICSYSYHQDRAYKTTGIELPELIVPDTYRTGRVKCRLLYDKIVHEVTFTPYKLPCIRSLQVVIAAQNLYPLKSADRSALDLLYQQRGVSDDILIVTDEGACMDSYFCNLLFEGETGLFTSNTPLLAGTRRAALIDSGVVQVVPISLSEIANYHTIHLINAMIDPYEVTLPIAAIQL